VEPLDIAIVWRKGQGTVGICNGKLY